MKPPTKWTLSDLLRLELLVHRHQAGRTAGQERSENAANQKIYDGLLHADPNLQQNRRKLLKRWAEKK